ncbi:DUF2559 family protein [Pantoea sp. Mb-10]|uniref:YhfG family protein n=1 Tax=unclassified Pantoea TaxID=2630326 RepID=UPI001E35B40C|nr:MULTISPECIES: YhfG family protein [unclassified Pantoea]MCE0492188.1 DUF2559 family protein [Pantoea sp. Mb-10]MCE0503191.1 DUF2559 family protein [Pantoea sp. Pb-8]
MTSKLTDKQKNTLWQQRRLANYQASCRLAGYTLSDIPLDDADARLASLRRQYGG